MRGGRVGFQAVYHQYPYYKKGLRLFTASLSLFRPEFINFRLKMIAMREEYGLTGYSVLQEICHNVA